MLVRCKYVLSWMNERGEHNSLGFGAQTIAFTLWLKILCTRFVFKVNKALYLQDAISTASLERGSLSLEGCSTFYSYIELIRAHCLKGNLSASPARDLFFTCVLGSSLGHLVYLSVLASVCSPSFTWNQQVLFSQKCVSLPINHNSCLFVIGEFLFFSYCVFIVLASLSVWHI